MGPDLHNRVGRRHRADLFPVVAWISLIGLVFSGCAPRINRHAERENWVTLFNGENLDGWYVKIHHHEPGVNFGNTFRVKDGVIQVRYDAYGDFNDQFGHLYTDEPYSYYHLKLEYRFVGELHPGAPDYTLRNSGVMLHAQDPRKMPKEQDWPISVEMQFLGGLDDGKPRPTGNMCSPGTDVFFNGRVDPRHCIESSSQTYNGEQWVEAEAIVLGDSLIKHVIEGDTVLVYSRPHIGGGVVNRYDPAVKVDGTPLKSGFIALQSEGQPVEFRNVRILNLSGCMDPGATNYRTYLVHHDPAACRYGPEVSR